MRTIRVTTKHLVTPPPRITKTYDPTTGSTVLPQESAEERRSPDGKIENYGVASTGEARACPFRWTLFSERHFFVAPVSPFFPFRHPTLGTERSMFPEASRGVRRIRRRGWGDKCSFVPYYFRVSLLFFFISGILNFRRNHDVRVGARAHKNTPQFLGTLWIIKPRADEIRFESH